MSSKQKKEEVGIWPITTATMDELVLCTVRYYLGRGSIAALSFPEVTLPKLFVECSPATQQFIIRDINKYIEDVGKGIAKEVFKGDTRYWKQFVEKHA